MVVHFVDFPDLFRGAREAVHEGGKVKDHVSGSDEIPEAGSGNVTSLEGHSWKRLDRAVEPEDREPWFSPGVQRGRAPGRRPRR